MLTRELLYEEQFDDCNSICPYCKYSYQVECEDYSEDGEVVECEECCKKYYLHQSFSVTHYSKPDCKLNGEEHQYQRVECTNGPANFCKICDHCSLLKKCE